MSIYTLLFTIISTSLLLFYIIDLIIEEKLTNDLLFFTILSIILGLTLLVFYFYFQDHLLSFIISFCFMVNSYFITRETKKIEKTSPLITIPYFLISIYYFTFFIFYLF